jgi:hypothetical protein
VSNTDFDSEKAVDRRLLYLVDPPEIERTAGLFARPIGKMLVPEEIPIFIVLFHLSSIVRYKPRFLDTIRDSDAWPLVLVARRHLLYRGMLLALSQVLQRNVVFRQR